MVLIDTRRYNLSNKKLIPSDIHRLNNNMQTPLDPPNVETTYQELKNKYPETLARLANLDPPMIICTNPQKVCRVGRMSQRHRIHGRPFGSDWTTLSPDDQGWFRHYTQMTRLRLELAKREQAKLSPEDCERYHQTFTAY
jgi:hypothetical protein